MTEHAATGERARLTRRRKVVYATLAMALSGTLALAGCLAADLYAHSRLDRAAGLNIWGYRGRVLGRKQPGEHRIVVLGGSTAFGYGVLPHETMPAVLERMLAARRKAVGQGPVSVANLAYNNEGAYAAKYNLMAYEFLDPDVALFHDGYNDLGKGNISVFRQESPIFRLTGYMPVLPLLLREKAMLLRYGSLENAYVAAQGRPTTVFRPDIADRATAAALEAADKISQSVERQLATFGERPAASRDEAFAGIVPRAEALTCGDRWVIFCQMVADNIDYALGRGMRVVVIGQPYHTAPIHKEQQAAMAGMIRARYADNHAVHFVDLGTAVDLSDRSIAYESVHLTAAGNERLAEHLVEPMMRVLNALPAEE